MAWTRRVARRERVLELKHVHGGLLVASRPRGPLGGKRLLCLHQAPLRRILRDAARHVRVDVARRAHSRQCPCELITLLVVRQGSSDDLQLHGVELLLGVVLRPSHFRVCLPLHSSQLCRRVPPRFCKLGDPLLSRLGHFLHRPLPRFSHVGGCAEPRSSDALRRVPTCASNLLLRKLPDAIRLGTKAG
jgi:hypothetical protein